MICIYINKLQIKLKENDLEHYYPSVYLFIYLSTYLSDVGIAT